MATFFALIIVVSALLWAFLTLYFFCAIARIWYYSKRQVALLEDIRNVIGTFITSESFSSYLMKKAKGE